MIQFTQKTIDLGQISPGSVHEVKFPFTGDKSKITHIEPSCGCTAKCEIRDDHIIATFTESDKNTRDTYKTNNGNNILSHFPSGLWPISKSITVYFNDGKDLKVTNQNGVVFNPEKQKEILTFNAKVEIEVG